MEEDMAALWIGEVVREFNRARAVMEPALRAEMFSSVRRWMRWFIRGV